MTEKNNPMNVSPTEAEEALAAIQNMTQKTRHSIAKSGAYIFLIVTGVIWLFGFLSTQFLPMSTLGYIWTALGLLGGTVSVILGVRSGKQVHLSAAAATGKRIGIFWLLLGLFCVATIAVVRPEDGKQLTMVIVLFVMIGQLATSLLLSVGPSWWVLPITALALVGYFLFPGIYYLWMAVLGGGGMVALGLYIRMRW